MANGSNNLSNILYTYLLTSLSLCLLFLDSSTSCHDISLAQWLVGSRPSRLALEPVMIHCHFEGGSLPKTSMQHDLLLLTVILLVAWVPNTTNVCYGWNTIFLYTAEPLPLGSIIGNLTNSHWFNIGRQRFWVGLSNLGGDGYQNLSHSKGNLASMILDGIYKYFSSDYLCMSIYVCL